MGLANPGTGQICALSEIGDQFPVEREWITSRISSGEELSFQWWFNDSEDLYCRLCPVNETAWKEEFGLDGLNQEQIDGVVGALVSRFVRQAREKTALALVVDRTGTFFEFDWDQLILGGTRLVALPDVLGLPVDMMRELEVPGDKQVRRRVIDGYVLLERLR